MSEEGFLTIYDCKFIMSKDEWKRFRMWVLTKPAKRLENGRLAWPYETIAQFFNAIEKEPPEGMV